MVTQLKKEEEINEESEAVYIRKKNQKKRKD